MANAAYPKWKQALLTAEADAGLDGTVKAILVDLADYTYNAAHDFLNDVPAAARVATSDVVDGATFTDGTFDDDASGVTFTAVTGDQAEAIIIYLDTGVEATSRLVAYLDTGVTGLPVTPSGGDIVLTWPTAILALT